MSTLMKCGHVAQGVDSKGNPVCVICVGITPDAEIIEDNLPDLNSRIAICTYCGKTRPSDFGLPFFEYRPDKRLDKWYDGCLGWN